MNDFAARLVNAVVALALLGLLVFPLLAPQPGAAISVWVAVVIVRWANAETLELAARSAGCHRGGDRGISVLGCVPLLIWCQGLLDYMVPLLGSSLVLFGTLAALSSTVQGSSFPSARLVR